MLNACTIFLLGKLFNNHEAQVRELEISIIDFRGVVLAD